MKNKLIHFSALLATATLMVLLSCEKKTNLKSMLKGGEDDSPVVNSTTTSGSTTGTTGGPEPPLLGQILGSCPSDFINVTVNHRVLALHAGSYASISAFVTNWVVGDRYYGVASNGGHSCIIHKIDGSPTVYLDYTSPLGSYNSILTLPDGSDFLPDEIEMTAGSTNNVYAIKGNNLYRIDNITTGTAEAIFIYNFPPTWAYYRRTICPTGSSTSLKVFVAETDALKGSTVNELKAYTLTNLNVTGGVSLSLLEATIVGIGYNNVLNLSSFSNRQGGFASDWYHIVISDGTANSSLTYRLGGTTTISGTFYSVGSFSSFVNDCGFYF